MQKQILYVSTLFCGIINYTMEQPIQLIPHIVYNAKNTPYALEAKLTQKFGPQSKCPKIEDAISHQSPEIMRVHSRDYLHNLEQCPSKTLSTINNDYYMALYPNRYSKSYLSPMLDNVSTTFAATEFVLNVNGITKLKPNYAISLAEGYSFAGYNSGNNGHVYAPIPTAAAHALKKYKDSIQHILVIDENITKNTVEYYLSNGNGSIFFPKKKSKLFKLFNNKITTQNQIPEELWDFLHNPNNKIDLAFYNINIDDIELIDGIAPADAKERERTILSLFYHFIPTVFILSGDKNNHQDAAYSLIEYIAEKAQKIASFNPPHEVTQPYTKAPINPQWEEIKNDCIKSAQNLMNYLEDKYSSLISKESQENDSHSESDFSESVSSSESYSDLEQEQQRLKKKLGIYYFSSKSESDYEATESSSTDEDQIPKKEI